MEAYIGFDEMGGYVKEHYHKDLSFARVDGEEVSVTFTQKVLITDVHFTVNIHIDEVRADAVLVTYKGGKALDMMISGALGYLSNKLPILQQGIHIGENHHILVNLSEMEKAKAFVENVELRSINVEEKGLRVTLALK